MKVMHLSTTDYGGAYEAAQRISDSLTDYGIESAVLVRTKTGDTPSIPFLILCRRSFCPRRRISLIFCYPRGILSSINMARISAGIRW